MKMLGEGGSTNLLGHRPHVFFNGTALLALKKRDLICKLLMFWLSALVILQEEMLYGGDGASEVCRKKLCCGVEGMEFQKKREG